MPAELPVPSADLQVAFYYRLCTLRPQMLSEAVQKTVEGLDLSTIDSQLKHFVPKSALKKVAALGVRGERVFPIPALLRKSPALLGYYRLLFGLSQKELYHTGKFGRFKKLEERGDAQGVADDQLSTLCYALCQTGAHLIDGLDTISVEIINELQLLTLGPQFRGSENTKIGERATEQVFALIERIVAPHVKEKTKRLIRLVNAAKRTVLVQFASDPDVLITESHKETTRQVLSIEVKGGADVSNIHNRLGEAEKSHLKAKRLGCTDLWTVLRVKLPLDAAQKASPTTTKFFQLDQLLNPATEQHLEFRGALLMRLGLAAD